MECFDFLIAWCLLVVVIFSGACGRYFNRLTGSGIFSGDVGVFSEVFSDDVQICPIFVGFSGACGKCLIWVIDSGEFSENAVAFHKVFSDDVPESVGVDDSCLLCGTEFEISLKMQKK